MLTLVEHPSSAYRERTRINANAGLTVAFAADFSSAGERLTASVAGARYVPVPLNNQSRAGLSQTVERILARLEFHNLTSINCAGNGIATLLKAFGSKHSPEALQTTIDGFVLEVFRKVHVRRPLTLIVSGGQTGADQSGIRAALALGVPCRCTMPAGYRVRIWINGGHQDIVQSREAALARLTGTQYEVADLGVADTPAMSI
jgi:hypothetical protein